MLYTPVNVSVAADQLEKLKKEISSLPSAASSGSFGGGGGRRKKNKISIKIQLKSKHGEQHLAEEHTLLLTRAQIASIEKARAANRQRFKTIRMSHRQVEKNISHPGGILGFLAGLARRALPALAKGVATGILNGMNGGNAAAAATATATGTNGEGLFLFKKGHCMKVEPMHGNGLYLTSHQHNFEKNFGQGLYLQRRNGLMEKLGSGLILGPNSPFKNIPILQWLL